MSIAVCTSTSLAVLDPANISSDLGGVTLGSIATAASWAADNSCLYVSSSTGSISKYSPDGKLVSEILKSSGGAIRALAVKDRASTIIYAQGNKATIFTTTTRKPTLVLDSPSHQPITSIALSADSSLLAITTNAAVQIQNLALTSTTNISLKSLPPSSPITIASFHPHRRTVLLVGGGNHLAVFDTLKPTSPTKIISLESKSPIVAITCSPISRSLVAVASREGSVGLIDLDKEGSLFRTLTLRVPLMSMSFLADGASLVLGTENGKILVQDLKSLDKPPKASVVDTGGGCIIALCIQKKVSARAVSSSSAATAVSPTSKAISGKQPLSSRDMNPAATGVSRRLSAETAKAPKLSVVSPRRVEDAKSTFSPSRTSVPRKGASARLDAVLAAAAKPASGRRDSPLSPVSGRGVKEVAAKGTEKPLRLQSRPSTSSTASNSPTSRSRPRLSASPELAPTVTTRANRVTSATPVASRTTTRPSETSSGTTVGENRRVSIQSDKLERTPSPELPSTDAVSPQHPAVKKDVSDPIPSSVKLAPAVSRLLGDEPVTTKSNMAVLGMGTPELERWIQAGAGPIDLDSDEDIDTKKRKVGWAQDKAAHSDDDEEELEEVKRVPLPPKPFRTAHFTPTRPTAAKSKSKAMQLSPMRKRAESAISPLRNTRSPGQSPLRRQPSSGALGSGAGAQDFLRGVIRDALYELHAEQSEDLRGLHVDLVKMARGFKTEMRSLMDEYVGDLKDLREENTALRKENDRLRRGY